MPACKALGSFLKDQIKLLQDHPCDLGGSSLTPELRSWFWMLARTEFSSNRSQKGKEQGAFWGVLEGPEYGLLSKPSELASFGAEYRSVPLSPNTA